MKKVIGLCVLLLMFASLCFSAAQYKVTKVTVTAIGTEVPLSATALYSSHVVIHADSTNTNNIYVGDSTVTAATGMPLAPGEKLYLGDLIRKDSNEAFDLTKIYIDADTNGNFARVGYVFNRYKGNEPAVQ